MSTQETIAQIRVVGPCPFKKYEDKLNEALQKMPDVFVVQIQTIAIDENTVYAIIMYKLNQEALR